MATIRFDHSSRVLGKMMQMDVCLPQCRGNLQRPEKGWKVLYLIHGWGDNNAAWSRLSAIERYVNDRPVVVVMPNANLSFYTDMAHGPAYSTYLTEELPALVKEFFHVSDAREDTFIAGPSMGGYGALRIALANPDQYGGAVCLGASNFVELLGHQAQNNPRPQWRKSMDNIYGDIFPNLMGTDQDLYQLARDAVAAGKKLPKIYHCLGDHDVAHESAQLLRSFFNSLPEGTVDYTYSEHPGYHEWAYWDGYICECMDALGITPVH